LPSAGTSFDGAVIASGAIEAAGMMVVAVDVACPELVFTAAFSTAAAMLQTLLTASQSLTGASAATILSFADALDEYSMLYGAIGDLDVLDGMLSNVCGAAVHCLQAFPTAPPSERTPSLWIVNRLARTRPSS
jgi:hypothetical protein